MWGLKNRLIKAFAKSNSKNEGSKHRFLIVSTTGLGDTLWGTPAIRALRKSFPHAYIAILTSPIGNALLKNNPHLDEIFVLRKPHFFSLLYLFFALRKQEIGRILLFHASQRLVFALCAFLRPSTLIATKGSNKGLDEIFTSLLDHAPVHEIERRLNIVREAGAQVDNPSLELFLSSKEENEAKAFIEKQKIPSHIPLIGLHPGAKDGFKKWPEQHFIEVGNRLADHLGAQVIVTGNGDEKALVERIASKIPGAIAVCGNLSLGGLSALIRKFSLMICNDTGPMHIAFAVHTPTVALFVPTDPRLCGPYFTNKHQVIARKRSCTPCLRKKCADAFCLLQISPQEVYDAALNLFYQETRNA